MTLGSAASSEPLPAQVQPQSRFALDVQYYLSQKPRQLPSRYLYDPLGSCLFEAICHLPWYTVTRAETRLLTAHRREILDTSSPVTHIVELGCGSGDKLATLVGGRTRPADTLNLRLIDVSPTALAQSTRTLQGDRGRARGRAFALTLFTAV